MKDTVTLKELAAIAVRRGRLAVILALILAVLLGGWRARTLFKESKSEDNSPEKIEERYQEALETYENTKGSLEKQITQAESQLESQQEYNEKSLLMEIDPYNKAVTTINFAITDVDEGAFQQVFRLENTPIDFIISKIQSQYLILWDSLDLHDSLSYAPRAGMEDKYLREIVTLSRVDGGCLTLTVFGTSEREARKLADSAYDCLLELQAVISEGSYLHRFAVLSSVTKILVDEGLGSIQTANLDQIVSYTDNIENLNEQLENLSEPEREEVRNPLKIALSAVKYAVLGAAVGVLLALVLILADYIFRNRAETSRQLEEGLAIPFLGSMAKPGGIWNRLADRMIGERIWPDEAQALQYISSGAKVLLPSSGTVLLASTLPLDAAAVQPLVKALESAGRTVRFVGDANRSPEMAENLKACGCVVLLERAGISHWDALTELASMAKSLDRPLSGFLTL